ncbi:MAG: nitrous oxide reductase family maturation protein NosD [Chitinophagaceae bacterium]|nr:nitrous oxide reductase family maturation protein NosD [Chitinophagaceae bacterium]
MRLFFTYLFLLVFASSRAGITPVSGKLQKAIDSAKPGDTLLLKKGVYREGTIRLTKSLTLLGEKGATLDGENKYEILHISGHDIVVSNIQFQYAGYSALDDYAAIKLIDANRVILENNTVLHAYFAIHISNTYNSIVRNNIISGKPKSEQLTGNGIHLWKCQNALIEKNKITGHRDGIYFEFVTESTIRDNTSEKNIRYGLHFMFSHNDKYFSNIFRNNGAGVAVMYSKKVVMHKNLFEENWGASAYGILLKEISDSEIEQNYFIKNTVGIFMEGSSRIKIGNNQFSNNGWAVRVQASCDDNEFYQNNFQGNSFDIATNGRLVLNSFTGNYWDKYEGYDLNRDGIGDVPFHPVSMYAMMVEQNPTTLILMRSFIVSLLDKAEKAMPALTPIDLNDSKPHMKPHKL